MEVKEPAPKYYRRMSAEEYLEWERKQEYKNEFHSGEIVAMSGASIAHNFINSNVFLAIGKYLEGKGCQIFNNELRVEVKAKESYFYPDIAIVCGELEIADDKQDMIKNPAVVIEILSPSTEQYDVKRKKFFYMQMPSLKEYIMIDSTSVSVDLIRREPSSDKWENEVIIDKSSSLYIRTIELALPLTEVYKNVKL
jgi:Uma2 family endonuclease